MQLQTQVPHRDWSSAAATSIPQPQPAPLMKTEKKKIKRLADRFGKHLLQIKL